RGGRARGDRGRGRAPAGGPHDARRAATMSATGSPNEQLVARSAAIEHYDRERGLKSIAVAEAAERHYRRAKDVTGLLQAVEQKLVEQRRFVLWWTQQEKHPGNRGSGRGRIRPLPIGNGLSAGQDGLPDRVTVHRWRIRLADEARFASTLEIAQAKCIRI